tara:strand:- start:402 stop:689 length:288 start_codon:yes stop_codon:yes gene_type:complete
MRGAVYYLILLNPNNHQEFRIEWKNINDTIRLLKKEVNNIYPDMNIIINKNTIYNYTKKDNKSMNRILKDCLKVRIQKESKVNIDFDLLENIYSP